MATNTTVFKFWQKLHKTAFGRWLFSKILCFKAPYFATVSPNISVLEQNLCEGSITQRRGIQNHIGSVHAIALCNLAELCAGLMTDVSIPEGMRWIPKEMNVKYLQKAFGEITAIATPAKEFHVATEGYEAIVNVFLTNRDSAEVFRAEIKMWISKKS